MKQSSTNDVLETFSCMRRYTKICPPLLSHCFGVAVPGFLPENQTEMCVIRLS